MARISLYDYQADAVAKLHVGSILCGGVGSGKSRTSLSWYYIRQGGKIGTPEYVEMKKPKDLYIITTARKRDTAEWAKELVPFLLSEDPTVNFYKNKVVIDSWNNIKKYQDISNAVFLFDEQRVVGYGEWSRAFIKIARANDWILLSATPGDTWNDYAPVFIANGFFKNITDFRSQHVNWDWRSKYPRIKSYNNIRRLVRLRDSILVTMDYHTPATAHHQDIPVEYNSVVYKDIFKSRWSPWETRPIESASELCFALRRVVNTDESRSEAILDLLKDHPKAIIFYSFNYELDILRSLAYPEGTLVAEWNGSKHEEIPKAERWVYLVQYTAGCEGWNCIDTDTIIFYSQQYSYKVATQAAGRIDRLNTPFQDLWYFHLKSYASIDIAIAKALSRKKNFNEGRFVYAG
jgi:hypothetical protein